LLKNSLFQLTIGNNFLTSKPQKMKIFTFSISLLLISIVNFAQSPLCPSFFRRNNGNGACNDGQLKLYFSTCPAIAPIIDSVYVEGSKSTVTFAMPDISNCSSLGYIGYCVSGGNMPPAALWKIYFHNTGSTNAFGCLVPQGGILPIGIKSFSAKRNGSSVVLNWQTSYESNGQAFEIQRKNGNSFVTIASVLPANIATGNLYTFTDKNITKGVSEYRLRLLSKDAEAVYSDVKSVKGAGVTVDFTVFPNPAVRDAKIFITDISEPTDVQVIDNMGRVVKTVTIKTSNTIELNNLQPGNYRIRLINKSSGESVTKALTVIQ